jgi:streptogramin lyase
MRGQGLIITLLTCAFAAALFGLARTAPARGGQPCSPEALIEMDAMRGTVGIAIDVRNTVYTAIRETGCVFSIAPSSAPVLLARVKGTPAVIAVDRMRQVYVGTEEGEIFRITPNGGASAVYPLGIRPVGMDIDRDGTLFAATESGTVIRLEQSAFTPAP